MMQEVTRTYLQKAKIGRKQSYQNLAVFPLLSPYATAPDYIMLDEALDRGLMEVAEVHESGSVPSQAPRRDLLFYHTAFCTGPGFDVSSCLDEQSYWEKSQ